MSGPVCVTTVSAIISLIPSQFFSACGTKMSWTIYSRERVISAGSVHNFVKCSDLYTPYEFYTEAVNWLKRVSSLEQASL